MSGGSKKSECIKKKMIKTTPLPPNITLSDEQSEVWDWPLLLSERSTDKLCTFNDQQTN